MKIIKLKINWNEQSSCLPKFEVLVDEFGTEHLAVADFFIEVKATNNQVAFDKDNIFMLKLLPLMLVEKAIQELIPHDAYILKVIAADDSIAYVPSTSPTKIRKPNGDICIIPNTKEISLILKRARRKRRKKSKCISKVCPIEYDKHIAAVCLKCREYERNPNQPEALPPAEEPTIEETIT